MASPTRKRWEDAGREAQRDPEGGLLRLREHIQSVEHPHAHLVQSRVGQLHLRFDARDLRDPKTGGPPSDVME